MKMAIDTRSLETERGKMSLEHEQECESETPGTSKQHKPGKYQGAVREGGGGNALFLRVYFQAEDVQHVDRKKENPGLENLAGGRKKSTFVQEKKARQKEPGRKKRLAEKGDS